MWLSWTLQGRHPDHLPSGEHLGEAFDLRAFNDLLLGNGALPLSVLGEVVDRWSASYSR